MLFATLLCGSLYMTVAFCRLEGTDSPIRGLGQVQDGGAGASKPAGNDHASVHSADVPVDMSPSAPSSDGLLIIAKVVTRTSPQPFVGSTAQGECAGACKRLAQASLATRYGMKEGWPQQRASCMAFWCSLVGCEDRKHRS